MFSNKWQGAWFKQCYSRSLSVSAISLASHYDALELSPKASQTEIKSAYYRLSKLYHPDMSKDQQADKKFRSITEAYEVLGNIRTKRLYDRGYMGKFHNDSDAPTKGATVSNRKSNITRHVDSETMNFYDLDAWTKEHYGKTFARSQTLRRETEFSKMIDERNTNMVKVEKAIFILFIIWFSAIFFFFKDTYDIDEVTESEKKKR